MSRRLNLEISRLRYSSAFGEYVCECGMKTCIEPISFAADEFEEITKEPGHFVVAIGHVRPRYGRVVRETSRYQVVELAGEAAEHAGRLERHSPSHAVSSD
jgi:hypothetical protein